MKKIWLVLCVLILIGILCALYIFIPRNLKFDIDLPSGFEFDYSNSELFVTANSSYMSITISNEWSPYEDTWGYIDYYQNRFYTNEQYQAENNITLHENRYVNMNGNKVQILTLTKDYENIEDDTYTYAYIQTDGGQHYTRFMFKSHQAFDEEYVKMYEKILNSYKLKNDLFRSKIIRFANKVMRKLFNCDNFFKEYKNVNHIETKAKENPNWDEKTRELYKSFKESNDLIWGLFIKGMHGDAIKNTIPELEEKINHKFEIMLVYNHLGDPLPLEAMEQMKDEDRIIELTYQMCVKNNEVLYGYTPMFDILDGKYDNEIRTLANEIKEFENPVLFRLNNEMNSDWTSYCGIIGLSDPEIYKGVWRRIYNIFEEENVTNCIWIFNPNDNNYPPSDWNNFIAYYPGDEYVQMIGVTGYNTGTYYAEKYGEKWRTFKEIYDGIDSKYLKYFSDFPWIITEFASSSYGGDKAEWITDMFDDIRNHKNIKAAVWFSEGDYNPETKEVARPYYLDETPETTEAFKNGLEKLEND